MTVATAVIRGPHETKLRALVRTDEAKGIFQVARRAFVDGGVMEREYEAVFDTCWLYLGHESELVKPGDFVTRTVCPRTAWWRSSRRRWPSRGSRPGRT